MTPTYDKPLNVSHLLGATYDFSAADFEFKIPVRVVSPRRADEIGTAKIVGLSGVVGAAGTGTLLIGDGTNTSRYGAFVADPGLASGDALTGELVLSEEGFRIGVDNDTGKKQTFVITNGAGGTLTVTDLIIVVGYFA